MRAKRLGCTSEMRCPAIHRCLVMLGRHELPLGDPDCIPRRLGGLPLHTAPAGGLYKYCTLSWCQSWKSSEGTEENKQVAESKLGKHPALRNVRSLISWMYVSRDEWGLDLHEGEETRYHRTGPNEWKPELKNTCSPIRSLTLKVRGLVQKGLLFVLGRKSSGPVVILWMAIIIFFYLTWVSHRLSCDRAKWAL